MIEEPENRELRNGISLNKLRLAGIVSGILFAVPNVFPGLAPLQLVALLPVMVLVLRKGTSLYGRFAAGFYVGLCYILVQLIVHQLPAPVTLILLLDFVLVFVIFSVAGAGLVRRYCLAGAVMVGALFVVLDWLNFTLVPFFATAQSITRCWSKYPTVIAFSSLTGITGISFVVVTLQALTATAIVNKQYRRKAALIIAVLIVAVGVSDLYVLSYKPVGTMKVAAVGWLSDSDIQVQSEAGFDALFERPCIEAARKGADLVVTPELAFIFSGTNKSYWFDLFKRIADENNMYLVVGYGDLNADEDKLVVIDDEGRVAAEYLKTYLTPFENFNRGTGEVIDVTIEGHRIGTMICQDDNFISISRAYGKIKTAVVAVPTLDWYQVKDAHFQSSIHRAIESRYAVVRAAIDGISAIISPTGKVLASMDHFKQGPGYVTAEVPLYSQVTLFSRAGHWPVVLSVLVLIIYVPIGLKKQFTFMDDKR